jgi:hypothetical protein
MKPIFIIIFCLVVFGCDPFAEIYPDRNIANYENCDKEKLVEWFTECMNGDNSLTTYGCEVYARKLFCDYKDN